MARPPKNYCDYFPHDAGMRNHKKIKAIRSKFGIAGYAIWSMILEHLTGNDGNVFEYSDMEFELMSGDFGVSATEIRDVVNYCITLELLFNDGGFIKSESLDERLAPVYQKRGVAKELAAKQRRVAGKFVANNAGSIGVSVTEMPQSKVKESKVKKKKRKETSDADVPSVTSERDFMDRVAKYMDQYPKEMLREFYDYWTEKNEGGRKMRFEMQDVFDISRRLKKWASNNEKRGRKSNGLTAEGTRDRLNSYTD